MAVAEIAASPTPDPTPTVTAVATTPAPISTPIPTPTVEQGVAAADDIRNAVTAKAGPIGHLVNTLDGFALQLGHTRVSVWDALVVLMVIALVVVLAWFTSKLAHWALTKLTRLDLTQKLLSEKLINITVWAIAILSGIDILGIDLTALAVFSGAFGLAIGFGLQKTFGNLIAGIILLMDRSIKPGDVIAVSDQAGQSTFGQIRRIGIRAVSVTTRDRREYLIPNENLMVNQVENWSYSDKNVRIQVPVGVSYHADLELAEELMLQAAKASPRILDVPPPSVWLDAYGDSSVNFVIQCWIRDPEEGVGNVRSDVLKRLWSLFKDNGVEIPFPQRDLNIRNNEQFEQLISALAQRLEQKDSGGD